MLVHNLKSASAMETIMTTGRESDVGSSFAQILSDKQVKCPYGYLAKDGIIQYNGVTFRCDPDTNSICLGDMSDPKKVLNVNLPSGGRLKININNFGDISRAAGMFSHQDLAAIMRAIYQYNHCTGKLEEIEQEESEAVMNESKAN